MRMAVFVECCILAFCTFVGVVQGTIDGDVEDGLGAAAFVFVGLNLAAGLFVGCALVWRWAT